MFDFRKSAAALLAVAAVGTMGLMPAGVQAQTLKAVMHSDVKILDPIWTTAYIQRNFGYMVWDTLFAMDEKFEVKPQMVDKWDVSKDGLTYTFTLRDGLKLHNGQPVRSADCIASLAASCTLSTALSAASLVELVAFSVASLAFSAMLSTAAAAPGAASFAFSFAWSIFSAAFALAFSLWFSTACLASSAFSLTVSGAFSQAPNPAAAIEAIASDVSIFIDIYPSVVSVS